jgi:hypothetical protein
VDGIAIAFNKANKKRTVCDKHVSLLTSFGTTQQEKNP